MRSRHPVRPSLDPAFLTRASVKPSVRSSRGGLIERGMNSHSLRLGTRRRGSSLGQPLLSTRLERVWIMEKHCVWGDASIRRHVYTFLPASHFTAPIPHRSSYLSATLQRYPSPLATGHRELLESLHSASHPSLHCQNHHHTTRQLRAKPHPRSPHLLSN